MFSTVVRYCAVIAVMGSAPGWAQERPLWEAGAGIGFITMPDYVGADEGQSYAFPIPYLVYRGDRLKLDRQGLRGYLLRRSRFKVDISANAGVPVRSDDNSTRRGMPDLDPTVELGPSLRVMLHDDPASPHEWSLRFPARAVYAVDFSDPQALGWIFNPHLNYELRDRGPGGAWEGGVALGVVYATRKYYQYYYSVAPEYEDLSIGRSTYDAEPGYGGVRLGLSVHKRYRRHWLGLFARYDYISGAVFEDSPLVRARHALLVGGGLSWIFARSTELVQVDD